MRIKKLKQSVPKIIQASLISFAMSLSMLQPVATAENVQNPVPTGNVSFTFDDGFLSDLTTTAPILANYGIDSTAYITTDYIGQSGYMSWNQVKTLKDSYGWEIGSHSVTHPLMTEISDEQIEYEVSQSKSILQQHGFNPTSFATPFGDYNDKVTAAIAKYYSNHRPFHDIELSNVWPYNDYLLQVKQVQAGVSVDQVKQYIDDARANNTWLVLVFHDVKNNASSNPEDYEYKTSDLNSIASYVKSQNIKTSTVSESLVTIDEDKLPNNGFEGGLNEGWTTDAPSNVMADNQNHGSYPNPADSIKMESATDREVHLFSPVENVDSTKTYVVKSYVNIVNIQSGEVAIYIDEYDAAGNWISGQYKGRLTSAETKSLNVSYNPTSNNVKKAGLQFIVTANSGITVYIDNVEWFSTQPEAVGPDPNPTPTENILANSSFNNGLGDGWTTDAPLNITPDNQNHGSPFTPQNSIKLTNSTKNVHLFSPKVSTNSTKTYSLKSFLNIVNIENGEIGFYVDEYDANNNWISGKYIKGIGSFGVKNNNFSYTPSSANVKKSSLQVIVTANSNTTAYIDDVEWLVSGTSPEPSPDPEPPINDNPNLLGDGSTFDNGFSSSWHTNSPSNILPDSNNHGKAGSEQYSVKLTDGASLQNNHLFSKTVDIDPSKKYIVTTYLNVENISSSADSEIAFYIDEYDTDGNWLSGQYLLAKKTVGSENIEISYTPSNVNIAKASLQVIVTHDSQITAYLDDVTWQLSSN